MISEYYLKYKGPNLTKATLNDVDITSIVQKFYGKNNNWQGRLWKYKDIFGNDAIGKNIYCEFHSDDGRKHWFYSWIENKHQFFNPPLATPMNQY